MDELEELRKRKLEELKKQQATQSEDSELKQQIEQLEFVVKKTFTKAALERYGNLKAAHPEKAVRLLVVLGQAIQEGQITRIDDDKLKQLLIKLTPKKKEFKIKRI